MSNIFNNLLTKIKNKKVSNTYNDIYEYAFSLEEIDNLHEENNKKIKSLKKDKLNLKKDENIITSTSKSIPNIEDISLNDNNLKEEVDKYEDEELIDSIPKELEEILSINDDNLDEESSFMDLSQVEQPTEEKPSFINLKKEEQERIMTSWKSIDLNLIDKDILEGKDILNHNYNITYADEAARYVHNIRKKYETVICYLIGFNNEKNGIENKIIFSDKIDNEWKFLENYIKLLEKIRNFRK